MPLGRKYRQTTCPNCQADLTQQGRLNVVAHLDVDGVLAGDKIVECAECTANIGDPLPTWVDSRGLDAETLANVAHHFDSEFWLEHKASQDHSIMEYFDFIYEACKAFQQFHAQKDWDTDGDYWEQIDWFMSALKAKATQADNEFPAWDAKGILQIIHDHAKPFLLRMLTTAGVSGTGTYMYLGLNGNWIMRSDLAVRFLSIDFAEATFRDQPGGLGTYDILDKTGKWLVRSLGDVPALGQVQGSGDESNRCHVCGKPFTIDSAGVATHDNPENPNGIDHNADADHVPYALEEES
jgi:hypothetical protein